MDAVIGSHVTRIVFAWISRFLSSPDDKPDEAAATKRAEAEQCKDLGNAHLARDELAAAAACYRKAIAIDAGYAEAHNNLGSVFSRQNRLPEAAACFETAIALKPALVQPRFNLANLHRQAGRLEESLACFKEALSLDPDNPDVHSNLGILLQEQGRLEDARACFERAIAARPGFAEAHNNLGTVFREQGRLDEARACFDAAAALKADFAEAQNNLGTIDQDQGRFADAYAHYRQALAFKPDYAEAMSNALLTAQYDPSLSPAELYAEHLRFAERFEQPLRHAWPSHRNSREPGRPLCVGFVSGDLRSHPVGFFLENVLAQLDRQALRITLYPTNSRTDSLSERLQLSGVAWHSLAGLSDEAAAQRIAADGIDILVDLSGHTADNRLLVFARKPAPVQVSWLYFSTTGLACFDYLLCDRHVLPAEDEPWFVERPWRLPDSYLCFTPPAGDAAPGPLPAATNGHVTFGCFNNLSKLNDAVVACWSRILLAVPGSRLLLKAKQLADPATRTAIAARFADLGVEPGQLMLDGPSARLDYLRSYGRVDIALDPFPFPGGTTTVEALWMGVPILSRRGDRFISRAGESILETVGLTGWLADGDDAYVAAAADFATRLDDLAELRASLRHRLLASPLCDAPRFARGLEAAFRGMWVEFVTAGTAAPTRL